MGVFEVFIWTGMQSPHDRYLVARDDGAVEQPEWKVYCVSVDPPTDDPSRDARLIHTGELEYAVWKNGVGFATSKRTVQYFCLSDVLAELGRAGIPARQMWTTDCTSVEWWHFQHHQGVVKDVSNFGDELRKIWPAHLVAVSGANLGALWRGRSFQ